MTYIFPIKEFLFVFDLLRFVQDCFVEAVVYTFWKDDELLFCIMWAYNCFVCPIKLPLNKIILPYLLEHIYSYFKLFYYIALIINCGSNKKIPLKYILGKNLYLRGLIVFVKIKDVSIKLNPKINRRSILRWQFLYNKHFSFRSFQFSAIINLRKAALRTTRKVLNEWGENLI